MRHLWASLWLAAHWALVAGVAATRSAMIEALETCECAAGMEVALGEGGGFMNGDTSMPPGTIQPYTNCVVYPGIMEPACSSDDGTRRPGVTVTGTAVAGATSITLNGTPYGYFDVSAPMRPSPSPVPSSDRLSFPEEKIRCAAGVDVRP